MKLRTLPWLCAALALVCTRPLAAATVPSRGPVHLAPARAATPSRFVPRPHGPHTFFGTIAGLHGTTILLRRRNGSLEKVDASVAIADNAYSQPLFIGKIVSIDGAFSNGAFVAAHIFRLTSLDDLRSDE